MERRTPAGGIPVLDFFVKRIIIENHYNEKNAVSPAVG
jgi:hypothetical protein